MRVCPNDFAASCSHTKAECFNAAGSKHTGGGVMAENAKERNNMHLFCVQNQVIRTGRRLLNMPLYANKRIQANQCIFVLGVHL